ncbi:MAG: sigma-54-dependent Fis family transcriptional regulator [Desulfobacterales bacterium]|nr:MAG: sigma-54-dependent Fis family transcriptional regulator [Desulfobacterales bacterium]
MAAPTFAFAEEARIFLLVADAHCRLSEPLREVLQSCENPRIQLLEKRVDALESERWAQCLGTCLSRFDPQLIFLLLDSPNLERADKLLRSAAGKTRRPVVAVIKSAEPEALIALLRLGVNDFITPPLRKVDVLPRLWRWLQPQTPDELLVQSLKAKIGPRQMVGQDPGFLAEINKIPIVAACDASVLIMGETGTGKELCARAIHYLSPRAGKPFVPVNCGAIPTELVENELFGHVKGAFTGASNSYPGLIHAANGGTLFLDEIDCLPLPAQAKLMRFLQDKEYRQLGSTKFHQADVRIVVASNMDLHQAASEGRFRRDLYYRLNVIPLNLPRLQDRTRDVALLARHFLNRYALEYNKPVVDFAPEAMQKLLLHDWPGNVRELENVVERAVIFCRQTNIQGADISLPAEAKSLEGPESLQTMKARMVADFEKKYIQDLLLAHRGNISQAAKVARKNRRAFWELIRKYQIDVQRFKGELTAKPG